MKAAAWARSSGIPGWREYFPAQLSRVRAACTASTMWAGVAKEGMPWPRETHPPTRAAIRGISLMAETLIPWTRLLIFMVMGPL